MAACLVAWAVPGGSPYSMVLVPGLEDPWGVLILVTALVGSVLVGLGRLWPGSVPAGRRGTAARVVLLGLNLFALVMAPVAFMRMGDEAHQRGALDSGAYTHGPYGDPVRGLRSHGRRVCNITAYSASGAEVRGIQLFDQRGEPLEVGCRQQSRRTVPWEVDGEPAWNVFPLGVREEPARTPQARNDVRGAEFPTPDRATTQRAVSPLTPGEGQADGKSADPSTQERDDATQPGASGPGDTVSPARNPRASASDRSSRSPHATPGR